MNVKKRPRLELATAVAATATDVALMSSSYGNVGIGNIANIGSIGNIGNIGNTTAAAGTTTNGLFLTTSSLAGIGGVDINNGAQIYLTICGEDDNSNESQEFYAIESIKQEPGGDLDALHHALLPTNLQLPTGCEIYLVKDTTTTTAATQAVSVATTATNATNNNNNNNDQLLQKHTQSIASIKLEPDSIHPSTPSTTNVLFVSGSNHHTPPNNTHNILVAATNNSNNNSNKNATNNRSSIAPNAPPSTTHSIGYNVKLDAYKKRDDKRRATHNEVERRRRDKINCWIFKLKEMLPTDGNRYKSPIDNPDVVLDSGRTTTTTAAAATTTTGTTTMTTTTTTTIKSNQNNGRTPPNDSKSQILIKACDYIKSMQNEIDNLRDCLREAESLRLSNQALRDELDNLKQQQELQERFNSAGGSFNVTLNSLNSSATSDLFDGIDTAPNLSTVSSINFTKRGLMITDYDE